MAKEKREVYKGLNHFVGLPEELINKIFNILAPEHTETDPIQMDLIRKNIAYTSRLFKNQVQDKRLIYKLLECFASGHQASMDSLLIFRPDLSITNIPIGFLVSKIIECSVEGKQDHVQRLIALNPNSLSRRGSFIDGAGREFFCSAFEYALWSLDVRYMGQMMLDSLPKNQQGEAIRLELLEQAVSLKASGLSYKLKGVQHQENHFSFGPLKSALQTYNQEFNNWTWQERSNHWCQVVGQAQLLLPAHIRQHYCDTDEPFNATPTFMKPQFKRSLTFYNFVGGKTQKWDVSLAGLGKDFAIFGEWDAEGMKVAVRATKDLESITELERIRVEIDLPEIYRRLSIPFEISSNPIIKCG